MIRDTEKKIAEHILKVHKYRDLNEGEGEVLSLNSHINKWSTNELGTKPHVYNPPSIHGPRLSHKVLSSDFIKKYIAIAKCTKPTMSNQALEEITEEYAKLRFIQCVESRDGQSQPITVRTLESLIRIFTAHAKARLAKHAQTKDVQATLELVRLSYNIKKLYETTKRKL